MEVQLQIADLFLFPFIQRALIAGVLVGFIAGYYGVFVVQRKMSFLGSGLSHAAFGGVALGLLLGLEPMMIAIPYTLITAFLIIYLKEKTRIGTDTSIGILFSVSVALGIVFLSLRKEFSAEAYSYLFGSILSVYLQDIYLTAIICIITILTAFKLWGRWAYATFDIELAKSDRLNVLLDEYLLSILLALSIVVTIKLVGIVLISAFLVIPAAAAKMTAKTFYSMTIISILISVLSSIAGLILSFYLDMPSGAVIILLQSLIFIVAAIFGRATR